MEPLIYIVEDDEGICEVYEGAFEDGYQIRLFETGASFLKDFCDKRPDIVILDIMLPDMDGYTILSKIRELDERIPVIIVSAKSDEISFVKGLNRGADDYMSKPFSVLELIARVKTNLRRAFRQYFNTDAVNRVIGCLHVIFRTHHTAYRRKIIFISTHRT